MSFFKDLFYKKHTITLRITSSNGFHLRPVAKFVSLSKTFDATVSMEFEGQSVSAKILNQILSLNLDQEDSFSLTAQGKDATEALEALETLFLTLMQDEVEVATIVKESHSYQGAMLEGESIYAGIAIAPLYHYEEKEHYEANQESFEVAVDKASQSLDQRMKREKNADIYLAQKELLLQVASEHTRLEDFALAMTASAEALKGGKLESKALDYYDLLRLVKSYLGYRYEVDLPKQAFVLIAKDLLPSEIASLEQSEVAGVILQEGALTSHTSILLRTAGIPSMLLASEIEVSQTEVILDTLAGVLVLNPTQADKHSADVRKKEAADKRDYAYQKRFEQAMTSKQVPISVFANVTDAKSATIAKEAGAEGIGLLRTEFLFTQTKPSLEIQEKAYREIFDTFEDVTVRTLDVGGDKSLPYIDLPQENNPFLGIRGVRLFQSHPELIAEQLHAIFLAAENRAIKIMFPMVNAVEEFVQSKAFALEVAQRHGLAIDQIKFGIMIEVPSVLFALEAFDAVVDFYSIGTNDLNQYLFAIERTHPTLKIETASPLLFDVLKQIIQTVQKPVSICGELASDTTVTQRLVSMGFKTLSLTSKHIPQIKESIRHV